MMTPIGQGAEGDPGVELKDDSLYLPVSTVPCVGATAPKHRITMNITRVVGMMILCGGIIAGDPGAEPLAAVANPPVHSTASHASNVDAYPGVPQSSTYEVTVT